MANWQNKAEFINQNARIATTKLNSPVNAYLGKTPTIVTYYHINSEQSTRDKGLQNVESLTGSTSGNRFNEIKDVPLYGIDMAELSLVESDESGLDSEVDGSFILPPNMFHPFPEDYFVIEHLNRPWTFRVTSVNYDTPTSNGFFRCEFELWSESDTDYDSLRKCVVKEFNCIFENIGTANKAVVSDTEFETLSKIRQIQFSLRDSYVTKFHDKRYNALMYMKFSNTHYLYDSILNYFCNKEKVFELDMYNTADCFLMYEERRNFHDVQYESSIFDRLTHRDLTDLDEVGKYYDIEPTQNDVSIFAYEYDERVKYLTAYPDKIGPFGAKLTEYIPANFLTALSLKNNAGLTDDYEKFIFMYMTSPINEVRKNLDLVDKRRIKYDMHSYVFIPMILYCLRQCYNSIVCDASIMDDSIINEYSINTKGGSVRYGRT